MDDQSQNTTAAAPAPTVAPAPAKTYQPDSPATLELEGIDGNTLYNDDGSPMTIDLVGSDSDIAIAARNQQQNRRLQQGQRLKLTAEALEADGAAYLAKLVTGWNLTPSKLVPGIDPGLGEGKVPFTPGAAVALFKHPKLAFIKDQPDRFVGERTRFLKA